MLVFKAGKIYPVVGDPIEDAMIKVDHNGKIREIGKNLEINSDDEIIDLEEKIIIPGLIDSHSHVGMWGDGEGMAGKDGNESVRPITGEVRAIDSVNPRQISFQAAREGGITTIQVLPGSGNVIGGLGFACKTSGDIIDDMVVKNPTGLKGATGENPKGAHGRQGHSPATRMAVASMIREYFEDARVYGEKKERAKKDGEAFSIDLNLESGLMVLRGDRKSVV